MMVWTKIEKGTFVHNLILFHSLKYYNKLKNTRINYLLNYWLFNIIKERSYNSILKNGGNFDNCLAENDATFSLIFFYIFKNKWIIKIFNLTGSSCILYMCNQIILPWSKSSRNSFWKFKIQFYSSKVILSSSKYSPLTATHLCQRLIQKHFWNSIVDISELSSIFPLSPFGC